ncbi:MAG: ABC transporter ATP-binding protein [Gemmatimonadetes bacterium]|nr:ABC transporter ATP-binding protein [Gemmatimonadota bacterium]
MHPLRRLVPFAAPYRAAMAWGVACVVLSSALYSLQPMFLRQAIDALQRGAAPSQLWRVAALMVSVALCTGLFRWQMREQLNGISRRIETDLRDRLFAHLMTLDAGWYARTRTGDVMARLTNDLGAVRMAAGPAIMYLINTIAGGLFALGFMIRLSPRLTVIALAPLLLLPVVMLRLGRAIHDRFESVQAHFSDLTTRVQENLSGARIVRAYRQEAAESARFGAMSTEYVHRNLALARLNALMSPSFTLIAGLGSVAVLGFGGAMVLRGTLTVGTLVAFGIYLTTLTWPLIALGWVTNLFQRGAASMTRLLEILDATPAVHDPAAPRALPPRVGGRSVEFRNVSFAYPPRDGAPPREVLRNVSFTIPAGGTLGVVGATGAGKSALLELLPRFFDPQSGSILIDGIDVRDLPLESLRAAIGFVPQDPLLFGETIAFNLAYGGADDAALSWAADVAQLSEAVTRLPAGLQTILGERGINLSGGQKQRATIARALGRQPAVVVLDDALSAVDTNTEAAILHGLRDALSGRTALIASHRVTALREASHIIVLADGTVAEQGTHEQLVARRGRYWELLRRQLLEESIESETDDAPAAASSAS